jgi:hypothetical protein
MGRELIQPIDPVSAKAISDAAQFGSKMIDAGTAVGRYTAGILGNLPHDLIGIAGDYVKHKRLKRAIELEQEYKKLLDDRGVKEPIDPSPSIAIPLLEAAVDEDRKVLRDLWARLLANACDPARTDRVRVSFIELLKKLDPFDAEVLQILGAVSGVPSPNPRDYVIAQSKRSEDEVMVSFENLIELGCLAKPNTMKCGSHSWPRADGFCYRPSVSRQHRTPALAPSTAKTIAGLISHPGGLQRLRSSEPRMAHVLRFRKSSICFGRSYMTVIRKLRNSTTSFASFSPVPFVPGLGCVPSFASSRTSCAHSFMIGRMRPLSARSSISSLRFLPFAPLARATS